jgi:multiple sugar transport system permease protein
MEAASVSQDRPVAKKRKRSAVGTEPKTPWWLWIAVTAIVVFCLLPFYWLVNISLKTGSDLSGSDIVPPNPSLDNYQSIFESSSFTKALRNSAIVSLVTTFLGIVVGSFAAYALARLRMRGKAILLAVVLSITTFPQIAIAAPLFRLWSDIGLYNTLIGLVIPYLTFALPLSSCRSSARYPRISRRRRSWMGRRTSRRSGRWSSRSPRRASPRRRS